MTSTQNIRGDLQMSLMRRLGSGSQRTNEQRHSISCDLGSVFDMKYLSLRQSVQVIYLVVIYHSSKTNISPF